MCRRISARSSAMPSPLTAEVRTFSPLDTSHCPLVPRSHLFPTTITGRFSACRRSSASSAVSPCDASSTTSTRSASARASIDFRIPIDSASSRASRMPAVSTSSTGMPPIATVSLTKSRVVPGVAPHGPHEPAASFHGHLHAAERLAAFLCWYPLLRHAAGQGMADPFRRWNTGFWSVQRCNRPEHRYHQPCRCQVVLGGHQGSIHQALPFRLYLARRNGARYRSGEGLLLHWIRITLLQRLSVVPHSFCVRRIQARLRRQPAGPDSCPRRLPRSATERHNLLVERHPLDMGHVEALRPDRFELHSIGYALLGYRYRRLLLSFPPCDVPSDAHTLGRSLRCTWHGRQLRGLSRVVCEVVSMGCLPTCHAGPRREEPQRGLVLRQTG